MAAHTRPAQALSKPIVAGANGAGGEGERVLDVIVAGSLPPNPAELLESEAMGEALARLRERYELVVMPESALMLALLHYLR